MMKHLWLALIIICSFGMLFHPGRTDEDGGHTDHSTGEYHYHHGYPAHQHPDGVCPYENEEPIYTHHESTNSAATTSRSSVNTEKGSRATKEKEPWWQKALWVISPFAFVGVSMAVVKGIMVAGDKIIEARQDRRARMLRGEHKKK